MLKRILTKIFDLEFRVWSASFLNVAAMGFQLWTVYQKRNTSSLSLAMLIIFLWVQLTFAQVGFRQKIWAQFFGMISSAIVSLILIILTFVY